MSAATLALVWVLTSIVVVIYYDKQDKDDS